MLQVKDLDAVKAILDKEGVAFSYLGRPQEQRKLTLSSGEHHMDIDIDEMRDVWFSTSAHLDALQCKNGKAEERAANYKKQPLALRLPQGWDGSFKSLGLSLTHAKSGVKAAIIREGCQWRP